ncbi:hypothetical protein LCGC14_1723800, partial [marine sediment metagenome]
SHPVYNLTRTGHTNWSLIEVLFNDGPYLNENTTPTTLLPSAATGLGINLTLSAVTGVNDDQGWLSTDIGRQVRYKKSSAWGSAIIVSITSTTVAVADVKNDFEATPTAQTTFRLGSWSGTNGYPGAVGFQEQRLAFAGSTDFPQGLWLSQSADFENMRPDNGSGTVADDDALDYFIAAGKVNTIRWLASGDNLTLGTVGGEWQVKHDGPLITPTDIDIKRQTSFGSANLQPAEMRGRLMFLQRAGRKLLEHDFSFEADRFQSLDMTLLSDHITKGGITDMAYQQEPDSVLWTVRGDGQMPVLTYMPEQNVVGWAREIIGGVFADGNTVVESVAVIPGTNADEVWVAVKRTINGATKRFVEYFSAAFEAGDDEKLAVYADSALTLDSPVTISGATKADPVVVTVTGHGFTDGNSIAHTVVVGMTELNGNTYRIADKGTNDYALVASTGHKEITGATVANPVVITSLAHGFSNGDMMGIFDALGMTEINGNTYKVANKTADTFELNTAGDAAIDGTSFTTWTSGGKVYDAIDGTAFTTYVSGGEARLEVSSLSDVDHLEGESVTILADGAVHPSKTVSSGAITLDYAASKVVVGLSYAHTYQSLKWEAGSPIGTAQGQIKRIHGVTLMLLDAMGSQVGPATDDTDVIPFRDVTDPMDTAVPLFTGEKFIPFDGDFATDARIVVTGSAPVPFTLLAIAPQIKTNPR